MVIPPMIFFYFPPSLCLYIVWMKDLKYQLAKRASLVHSGGCRLCFLFPVESTLLVHCVFAFPYNPIFQTLLSSRLLQEKILVLFKYAELANHEER